MLDRRDWNIEWNPLIELGGLLVGPDVRGAIEIQAVEEKVKLESPVSDGQVVATG